MMIRKEATKTTKNRGKAIAAGAISFSYFRWIDAGFRRYVQLEPRIP